LSFVRGQLKSLRPHVVRYMTRSFWSRFDLEEAIQVFDQVAVR
jgi:hypothetical protein